MSNVIGDFEYQVFKIYKYQLFYLFIHLRYKAMDSPPPSLMSNFLQEF